MSITWTPIDNQMRAWSTRLRDDLNIVPPESLALATTIAREVTSLSDEAKQRVRNATPIPLSIRLEELRAFQGWMDLVREDHQRKPAAVRAQVITQNYICFVYLGEACFNVLRREAANGSATKKCCKFLTDNPVRAFRNATAHSNWQYLPNFSGIEYWAKKGADASEPLSRFDVSQNDLNFWQSLARCVAYSSYSNLQ